MHMWYITTRDNHMLDKPVKPAVPRPSVAAAVSSSGLYQTG